MKQASDDQSEEDVILVYNGRLEVSANRQALAKSCFYLEQLLTGPFRESRQSRIEIHLGDEFSFDVFKATIDYANLQIFDRNNEVSHYLDMRELSELWMYDELAEILDSHLISCFSLDTLVSIHTRANIFNWTRLRDECLRVERILDTSPESVHRHWARCPLPGHSKHHYSCCTAPPTSMLMKKEGNWDGHDRDKDFLTEEEKDEIADIREARGLYGLRRSYYRYRKG